MGAVFFYENDVENYQGGPNRLTLSVCERDGIIGIGLEPADGGEPLMCAMEPEEAEKVLRALSTAIDRLAYKTRK